MKGMKTFLIKSNAVQSPKSKVQSARWVRRWTLVGWTLGLWLGLGLLGAHAASTIFSVTPVGSATEDKRIQLSNSNFARTWSSTLGTNWTKLRVALRVIMTNNAGASIAGSPVFAVGVCAGTNNIFQDLTCSNWVGVVTTEATWAFAGTGTNIYFQSLNANAATKVGALMTTGAVMTTALHIKADPSALNRSLLFVDITKGVGTNITVGAFMRTASNVADVSYDTFLERAEVAVPVEAFHAFVTPVAVPVDEAANGYLNSVNVAWGITTPHIHICDVAIVKLQ